MSRTNAFLLGLPGTASNLRNKKIHTERCILVVQEALELCNLFSEHVWGVANATDHTDAAGVGDCCCELRASSNVHAGEHDRVCDLEQVGGHRADLLCLVVSMLFTLLLRVESGLRGEVIIAVVLERGHWFEASNKEILFEGM
jgi:hypothetical protein